MTDVCFEAGTPESRLATKEMNAVRWVCHAISLLDSDHDYRIIRTIHHLVNSKASLIITYFHMPQYVVSSKILVFLYIYLSLPQPVTGFAEGSHATYNLA